MIENVLKINLLIAFKIVFKISWYVLYLNTYCILHPVSWNVLYRELSVLLHPFFLHMLISRTDLHSGGSGLTALRATLS